MAKRLKLSACAFLLTSALGAAVTFGVYVTEHAREKLQFDREVAATAALIRDRLGKDLAYLTATRAFINAYPEELSRNRFAEFVDKLGVNGPDLGVQGFGFAQILQPGTEDAVRKRMTEDYGQTRGIWPHGVAGLRTAIVLLEPADARNRAAIGFDMFSEQVRRAAMETARVTGLPAATAPVTLVQEIDGSPQPGILLYLYQEGSATGAPSGFVYTPVRMGDLLHSVLATNPPRFEFSVRDAAAPAPALYMTPNFARSGGTGSVISTFTVNVAGREWLFEGRSMVTLHWLSEHIFSLITALAMAVLALVSAMAAHAQTAAVNRAKALQLAQEQSMREKDLHLREMSHRVKNSLTRVVAMARQAARGAESKEEFVTSMNMRLRAMANAQDMLTRSATGSTDLRELLSSELSQIGSLREGFAELQGPRVQLDPRETQALGLSFHELATNALKYGAGAYEGAHLSIRWSLATPADKIFLTLIWDEIIDRPMTEPSYKGFGSQLLDSCIKLELGGTILRRYHGKGLTVEIKVPLTPFLDP